MKQILLILFCSSFLVSALAQKQKSQFISYQQVQLTKKEKLNLTKKIQDYNARYDDTEKMVTKNINAYNYHTDAVDGVYHDVRNSLIYAVELLDLGDKRYTKRAFDIIEKTISLQDTNRLSPTCGIWPYFMEEPLATKKSPPDFNWADFNAVSLLDVLMGHEARIPKALKPKIERSLVYAARSIQKRNVGPGYTNIAIMGTYVTYMTGQMFDIAVLKEYAQKRLKTFYNYTLEKGGFTEYNSPYTITALNEMERMKMHIISPEAKPMIDSLYASANRSGLWNQRRPFLAYWGAIQKPYYLQVRFLHDSYDFSSASFYSQQKENSLLAGINFILNGGDKHISIDRIKDGKFKAKDLR